ncbi:MAG: hypothetical protein WC476_12980 [Phycisphaerae bacterium]|jgi:hypothetical protein
MAKQTVEQIVEEWIGDGETRKVLSFLSDDEFIGYIAGVGRMQNMSVGGTIEDWFNAVRKIAKAGVK